MPRPATRKAMPSSTPTGMVTVRLSVFSTSPRPPQSWQGWSIALPLPWHADYPLKKHFLAHTATHILIF